MSQGPKQVDAVIVGAGFAGMYMLYRLRKAGLTATILETADDVGGTWYWNRYPGARCDIESFQYSYSFSSALQQEWDWTERYATQPEILRYAEHVADRFKLRTDIRFGCTVTATYFEQDQNGWLTTFSNANDEIEQLSSQFCIMATGCLSAPNIPYFKDIDTFHGPIFHTGTWPHHEVDFTGKKVAVIGTGSSGIQSIPQIAKQAKHLFVFQRTPNYIVPAQNKSLSESDRESLKANYDAIRTQAASTRNGLAYDVNKQLALDVSDEARKQHYQSKWDEGGLPFASAYLDLVKSQEANDTAAEFVREKIHHVVKDPETAKLLTPTYTFACKRLCIDIDYYETFNRDNVSLIDIQQSGIERIEKLGPVAQDTVYEIDVIVLATGFDAMTGALKKIDIRGKNGERLTDKWANGPLSFLGLMVSGFPNLFTITGPGSPSVLSNVIGSIEHHVDWIHDLILHMTNNQLRYADASLEAESDWVDEVNAVVDKTLYRTCRSWYSGKNIPGKPSVFMPYPGVPPYKKRCQEIAINNYTGIDLRASYKSKPPR